MANKDPQPPRNGKADKPPVPPPFQRLTTPSKWVAPMSAAPPSFRRQKVDVVRAPAAADAGDAAPTAEAPIETPAPEARQPEVTPPIQPPPMPVEQPAEAEEPAAPESIQPEVIETGATARPTDATARPYTRPAPQIGPEFVSTDAAAPRPSRRPIPKYPILARTCLILAALCAAVFLGIAVWASGLWLHSLGVIDRALFESSAGTSHWAESYAGAIYFHAESVPASRRRAESFWQLEMGDRFSRFDPPPNIPGAATNGITRATVPLARTGASASYVVVSYWLIVLAFIVPGALAIWLFRRLRGRLRKFRCPHCQANMRDSPFRCPSCGMPGPLAELS